MRHILTLVIALLALQSHISASETIDTNIVKMPTCVVDGKVLYYAGKKVIPDAKIRLIDKSGKEFVTASDMSGYFQFKLLNAGEYMLTATHMGYDSFTSKYDLTEGRCVIYIRMKPSQDMIEGATVIAEAALLRQVADTTIYNAASLKTNAWDDALELLKQIPGASVSGGQITIHGEPVARTFVNGTLVFGDNPITAFKQLLASDVTHLKVYDEISVEDKLLGKKNSRKERILNIITKEKINVAIRGNVEAGVGLDEHRTLENKIQPRYGINGRANLHSKMLQINFRAGSNNVGALQAEHFHPDHNKPLTAYSENSLVDLMLIKYWGDRILGNHVELYYRYDNEYNKDKAISVTDYFATMTSPEISLRDTSTTKNTNKNHYLCLRLSAPKTKIGTIHAKVGASIGDNSSYLLNNRFEALSTILNNYSENRSSHLKPVSYSTTLRWRNRFGSFVPYISTELIYDNTNTQRSLIDTLGTHTYPKRVLHGKGNGGHLDIVSTAGSKVYLTNTDKQTIMLDAGYEFEIIDNANKTTTYNSFGVEVPIIDLTNTFDYRWRTMSHGLNLTCYRDTRLTNLEACLKPVLKTSYNSEAYPAKYEQGKTYFAICPSVQFIYKKRIKMGLTTDTTIPTMEQSRPKINDAIQSLLTAGNPDLNQSYTSKLSLSYSTKPDAKKPFWETNILASVTSDPIASRMIFITNDTTLDQYDGYVAKAGSLLTTYANAPVMASFSLMTTVTGMTNTRHPWYARLTYSYRYLPQYTSDALMYLNEHSPAFMGRYSHRFAFGMKTNFTGTLMYTNSRNTEKQLINEAIGCKAGISLDWLFQKRFQIKCSYDLSIYHMINRNTTNITHEMQASFKYEILRNRLYMTISGHDLLNTNDSYFVQSTATQLTQKWIPAYGRYYLAGIIWQFRKDK